MNAEQFISRLGMKAKARKNSNGFKACCPAHEDKTPSLEVATGNDGRILIHCHAGCSTDSILAAVGLKPADLFQTNGGGVAIMPSKTPSPAKPKIVAHYGYKDERGNLLFQVERREPKDFRQRKPDGSGGFEYSVKDVRPVPYRLPQLLAQVKAGCPVFICEGEKDCDAAAEVWLTATCNAGGAGKWKPEFAEHFQGATVAIIADKDAPGRKHAHEVASNLAPVAKRVCVIELPDLNGAKVKDFADYIVAGGTACDALKLAFDAEAWTPQSAPDPLPAQEADKDRIREMLKLRRFSFLKPIPPVDSVFSLGGVDICTPANLTAITAQIKSGKSSLLSAMMAAAMTGDPEADCLGVKSSDRDGKAIIHIDTEQAPQDWDAIVRQAIIRARIESSPDWLVSYTLTGCTLPDARAALPIILEDEAKAHGGIHSVMIDGVADLVPSVNDEEESLAFVANLHGLAIQYVCPIIGAIHFNPNSDKTRGHLGSQLERKAETNLKLDKDVNEVVTVYSLKSRRAPITKADGPRFKWDPIAGMHVSIASEGSAKSEADFEEMRNHAVAALAKALKDALGYTDFCRELAEVTSLTDSGARKRFDKMIRARVVTKNIIGRYALTQ